MFESEKLELALRNLFGLMPAKELQKCKKKYQQGIKSIPRSNRERQHNRVTRSYQRRFIDGQEKTKRR